MELNLLKGTRPDGEEEMEVVELDEVTEETTLISNDENETKEKKIPYPKSVFFIIGNEFCERFSYYGMKAVLTLYLTNILMYHDDSATAIYHVFSMACYFTPILGAMLADSLLGKFKTIFYVSIVYAAGNIVLSVAAIPNSLSVMIPVSMVGLTLIAIGTGGIKPCVSAFGGDQFVPGQEKQLESFFSLFYMSINLGSVLSTVITPLLREDVKCAGQDSCFSLAFGVPAVLMVVSLVLFLVGRPMYKIIPPSGNIVIKVMKCIGHALSRKTSSHGVKRDHWLDHADDKYDKKLISDIKAVLKVLFLYLPLPVFWALFDQQGSRWTLQATKMDGTISPHLRIKPDQMQVINPLLIIAFIPVFHYIIYPALAKCHIPLRPLQRITIGGVLAAAAFVVAGFVQMHLEASLPVLPAEGFSKVSFINNAPCSIAITSDQFKKDLETNGVVNTESFKMMEAYEINFEPKQCSEALEPRKESFMFNDTVEVIAVFHDKQQFILYQVNDTLEKPQKGDSNVRIIFNVKYDYQKDENFTFLLLEDDGTQEYTFKPLNETSETNSGIGRTNYTEISPGTYNLYILYRGIEKTPVNGSITVKAGGNYIIMVSNSSEGRAETYTMVNPNSVSMLLQVPQYVIITFGEIMFSITGLEFSYSQAPKSMKSVLQAGWLLTVAFGNLIVVIVAEAKKLDKQSTEFFMFAGLMGADMLLFALMAYFYKYVEISEDQDSGTELNFSEKETKNGLTNYGYEESSSKL